MPSMQNAANNHEYRSVPITALAESLGFSSCSITCFTCTDCGFGCNYFSILAET